MTLVDKTDTQSTDLAVFHEQTAGLAQYPDQVRDAVKEIGADLEAWYTAAESAGDSTAMTAIQTTWSRVEQMAIISNEQQEALVWLATIAQNLKAQRDNTNLQLTTLVNAIETADTDHPLVAEIFDIAWENACEQFDNDGFNVNDEGIHTDTPGQDVVDNGHLPDVDANTVDQFLNLVMGYSDEMSEELNARLAALINDFTAEARAYFKADWERRERENAEFEALMKQQEATFNGR